MGIFSFSQGTQRHCNQCKITYQHWGTLGAFPVDPCIPKPAKTARGRVSFCSDEALKRLGPWQFSDQKWEAKSKKCQWSSRVYRPSAPIECWEIILPFTHPALTLSEPNGNLLKGVCLTWNSFKLIWPFTNYICPSDPFLCVPQHCESTAWLICSWLLLGLRKRGGSEQWKLCYTKFWESQKVACTWII